MFLIKTFLGFLRPKRRSKRPSASSQSPTTTDSPAKPFPLATLLPLIYNSQRVPLDLDTLYALRLTSRSVRSAADCFMTKINIDHSDLNLLKKSSFTPYVFEVRFDPHESLDISRAVSRFCTEISLPNLVVLAIDSLDSASLEILSKSSWPRLKILDILVDNPDSIPRSNNYLEGWKKTNWPLEYLSVLFKEDGSKYFAAVANTLSAFPLLTTLHLNLISEYGATAISKANLKKLETLTLACPCSDRDWAGIAGALSKANFPKMNNLMLLKTSFTPKEISKLAKTPWFGNLEVLNLGCSPISREQARSLLRGLNEGPISVLLLSCPYESLSEFEEHSFPELNNLSLSLSASEAADIDLPMEAFLKSHIPEVMRISIECTGEHLSWNQPPHFIYDPEYHDFLFGLPNFSLTIWSASAAVMQFLGDFVIGQTADTFSLNIQASNSNIPMVNLLDAVPQIAELAEHEDYLPLEQLSIPITKQCIAGMFEDLDAHFPYLESFHGTDIGVIGAEEPENVNSSAWCVHLRGLRQRPESDDEPQMTQLQLKAESVLEFLQHYGGEVVSFTRLRLKFPVKAETPEEKHARDVLVGMFPTARVSGAGKG